MIRRVLLAIDRSGHADDAVRVTADLAAALRADVRVLHCHEAPATASMYAPDELRRAHVETIEGAHTLVERTVVRLREHGLEVSGDVSLECGPTASRIVVAARASGAGLIVMGTLGESGWRRLLVGSVARAVVQLADCPVLVVPGRTTYGDLRRLVVGVDGSAGAARAVAITSELASRLQASVLVVHAVDGTPGDYEPDAVVAAAARAVGRERVAAVRVRVAAEGGVARTLGDEAREFRAGVLVVGRRGRSPLQRLLLGGVSERLLQVTPCPLLVVPPPGRTVREGREEVD